MPPPLLEAPTHGGQLIPPGWAGKKTDTQRCGQSWLRWHSSSTESHGALFPGDRLECLAPVENGEQCGRRWGGEGQAGMGMPAGCTSLCIAETIWKDGHTQALGWAAMVLPTDGVADSQQVLSACCIPSSLCMHGHSQWSDIQSPALWQGGCSGCPRLGV